MKNYIISKFKYNEVKPVFNKVDFPYALVKGEALSLQAYGRLGARHSGDIDVLVSKKNALKLKNILIQNDFKEYDGDEEERKKELLTLIGSHQLKSFKKECAFGVVEVDVNFDLFWGQYKGKRIDVDNFIRDVEEIDVFGMKVNTLSPLKALIQLILHHYKEMNSLYHLVFFNTIRTDMFLDVYNLMKKNKEIITPSQLFGLCSEYEINEYAYYVLYYTQQVVNDIDFLHEYLKLLYTEKSINIINRYGLRESEYGEWKIPFKDRIDKTDLRTQILPYASSEVIKNLKVNYELFI